MLNKLRIGQVGTPMSAQAKNKKRLGAWKAKVRAGATDGWPSAEPPVKRHLLVTIVFYFDEVTLDTDNVIKPILDALCGLIYDDDTQITDVRSSKRDLKSSFVVAGSGR